MATSLSSSADYFLVSCAGETLAGEGYVITVDPDGGVTTRNGLPLEEARALVRILSNGQHGYREVYLLAHESELALYKYRDGEPQRLESLRPSPGPRARLSPLAHMS